MRRVVLLVDDDRSVLQAWRRLLARHADVQVADGAEEAVALLEARSFHVVITDLDMPGRDGLWLLERLRSSWPGVRRVLCSGRDAAALQGIAALADRVLSKPASLEELLASISEDSGNPVVGR